MAAGKQGPDPDHGADRRQGPDRSMGQVKRLPEYKLIHNRPHIQRHGGKITPAAMRGTNEAEDGPKPVKIQRGAHNEQIKPGLSDS